MMTTTERTPFTTLLKILVQKPETFTAPLALEAAHQIMQGTATQAQIGAFLVALKAGGFENDPAVVAAVGGAMRDASLTIDGLHAEDVDALGNDLVDIVGTGGDGQDTFNVSTAAGIVCAGAGCYVAKHGNRASSSKCGSADVLESLGCHIDAIQPASVPSLLRSGGFCFLFSQTFHPAMKNVASARREIGIRTIFNLLGPLSSPAKPKRCVVGVHSPKIGPMMAEALRLSGVQRAWVVCGEMGLDEISPEGKTHVWSLELNGEITEGVVTPSDFGLQSHPLSAVVGGIPDHNAKVMKELLDGQLVGPVLDFVLLNAGALLYVAGKAPTLKDAAEMARQSIVTGRAKKALEAFAKESETLKKQAA
ncbi:glycosyl transferase family, a/b domain-containing protein [Gaertneriomyces semiglobifer]|nr:glycosyl transferase family, a/b domain-containing protein [Gaertneriomyces semiglobifer]